MGVANCLGCLLPVCRRLGAASVAVMAGHGLYRRSVMCGVHIMWYCNQSGLRCKARFLHLPKRDYAKAFLEASVEYTAAKHTLIDSAVAWRNCFSMLHPLASRSTMTVLYMHSLCGAQGKKMEPALTQMEHTNLQVPGIGTCEGCSTFMAFRSEHV